MTGQVQLHLPFPKRRKRLEAKINGNGTRKPHCSTFNTGCALDNIQKAPVTYHREKHLAEKNEQVVYGGESLDKDKD